MEDDIDVLREVPDSLQRLVRFTVRGFYGIEHGLTIDVLVRNACVKEEDIQELLKFDKKQLRVVLNQLKNDKFLKSRPYVETQDDGKVTRHNYYYVNYRSVANVIKYKLHHMHKRIETMERDETNRPSFKCPTCQNTYSDLEVNQLIDPMFDGKEKMIHTSKHLSSDCFLELVIGIKRSGTLNCTFCRTEVIEDKAASATQDGRTLQARFNEQMEPVYKLLKEVENVNLSDDVLEPKPTLIPHLHPSASRTSKPKAKSDDNWSTGRSAMGIITEQDVVIDLGADKKEEHQHKELPIWMTKSTVAGSENQATTSRIQEPVSQVETDAKHIDDEVLQTLLVQERSSKPPVPLYPSARHEEEEESDEFEDVDDDEVMVTAAGKPYTYQEVTLRGQELINLMTPSERANYISIGRRLYEDMDD